MLKMINITICCEMVFIAQIRERRNTWYFVCDLFLCFYTRTCDYAQMSPKELEYISSYDWLCHWPSWKVLRQDLSRSLGRTSFDHLCLVSKSKTKVSCVLSPFVGPPCISLYQVSQAVTAIIGFLRRATFKRCSRTQMNQGWQQSVGHLQ